MPTASTRKKLIVALLLAVALPATHAASMRETAIAAAEDGHYAQALKHYRTAAEQGDRAAQRIAGLMLYYGERLYGGEIHRDSAAARRYLTMAARQGCEVSKFMLGRLAAE